MLVSNPRGLPVLMTGDPVDYSGLRRHLRSFHRLMHVPWANQAAGIAHAREHGLHYCSHEHVDSPLVLMISQSGHVLGERWLGWLTGRGAVSRAEIDQRARKAAVAEDVS